MSTFREHKSSSDRSAADRGRHKKKIERALKEGIQDIVAEKSIIGKNGKARIRIPVKGIKEYRFIHGKNQRYSGSAKGKDIHTGKRIGRADSSQKGKGESGEAGDAPGEEFYDVEVTIEELAEYIFSNLELPDLEKKNFRFIDQERTKRKGHRSQGIRVRLSKKETLKNKIKRQKDAERAGTFDPEDDERFPFHETDLRYRHVTTKQKENTSAVIFFIMDVSGSMTQKKKYMARSFYFLLYQFLRLKYEDVDVIFISHDTGAKEVTEDEFFTRQSSGGTFISPALKLMQEVVERQYHPSLWNIYGFHCSDGDNWASDIPRAIEYTKKAIDICQIYAYCEISPKEEVYYGASANSDMWRAYDNANIVDKKFRRFQMTESSHIWPAFSLIFGKDKNV